MGNNSKNNEHFKKEMYHHVEYADNMSVVSSSSEQSFYDTGTKANPSIPGRAPKRPDSALSVAELERRNRRRARNREAAERQRNRRVAKVQTLEDEVAQLRKEKEVLSDENRALKDEIEKVRFQLNVLER